MFNTKVEKLLVSNEQLVFLGFIKSKCDKEIKPCVLFLATENGIERSVFRVSR